MDLGAPIDPQPRSDPSHSSHQPLPPVSAGVDVLPPPQDPDSAPSSVSSDTSIVDHPSRLSMDESTHGSQHTAAGPPAHTTVPVIHEQPAHTASAVHTTPTSVPQATETPIHPKAQAPTATIDPNVPSSESAPTALPTNPSVHPAEQREALEKEPPHVIQREVEKTKAAEREIKGEAPLGTMIKGIEDDRLWAMLRRFDVQVTHVLHPAASTPAAEPDLRPSTLPNLPSHSEALKSNLERVFTAIGPSSVRGIREAGRLMDWSPQERTRTASYCVAYFICWIFGYTLIGVFTFMAVMVCFPETRRFLFPAPAPPPFTPPSATDPTNQKGDESLLGITDSKMGHRSKAEQAEEQAFEATSILQAYTTHLLFGGGKKVGKKAGNANVGEKRVESSSSSSDSDDDDESKTKKYTDPTTKTLIQIDESDTTQGLDSADVVIGGKKIRADKPLTEKQKKKLKAEEAKKKRDEMVQHMAKMTETGLGGLADMFEMLQNAVSPPGPYPDRGARFKIAGAFLVPPALLLTFVPAWIFGRAATFLFGVGFWGQPLIERGIKEFVRRVPNWQELMDLRNSILSGVPTEAQLTLHLLRVGEALNNPLPRPPPPPLAGTPKEAIKDASPATITEDDHEEIAQAEQEGGIKETTTKAKVNAKSHIVSAFRTVGKKMAGFHGDVQVEGTRKKIGSKIDKVLFKGQIKDDKSSESYPAKLGSISGHIIIEPRNDVLQAPQVSFVPLTSPKPEFVRAIDDIVELKKAHVSMPRLALGYVSGAEVEGLGLTIRFKDVGQQLSEWAGGDSVEGDTLHFTRVGRREQLFVRLISMGRQRWEQL